MAKDAQTVLAANLQRFIAAKGYSSVEKFAYEMGFSKGGLGKILQGKRMPRLDTVVKLAQALEVTLDDLYPVGGDAKADVTLTRRLKLEKVKTARDLLSEVLEVEASGETKKKKR
jgi:transcriptional regulator with XRE-family HTH domain